MKKAKVLAIAPYKGLCDLIEEIAKTRDDIEVDTDTGDMQNGADIAKRAGSNDYLAIISRAGTAALIQQVTDKPVIDIGLSVSDMLRAIRLAQSYGGRFAVVGFAKIVQNARIIKDLLQYSLDIVTVHHESEIISCLQELKRNGFDLIVGDMVTTKIAKRLAFNAILVTSGQESVTEAFDQAVKWNSTLEDARQKTALFSSILEDTPSIIHVFADTRKLTYSNIHAEHELYGLLEQELEKFVGDILNGSDLDTVMNIGNSYLKISGKKLMNGDRLYAVFYSEIAGNLLQRDNRAIVFNTLEDVPIVNFETFNSSNPVLRHFITSIKKIGNMRYPVLIQGAKGTGKDTAAYAIYYNSPFYHNQMIIIDCAYMDSSEWGNILSGGSSLLDTGDTVLYFKNIHFMDASTQLKLLRYIQQKKIHEKSRLLFSHVPGEDPNFEKNILFDAIRNRLYAFTVSMPSLNQRRDDIPRLAILYLNELNIRLGTQVIGFQPAAMRLLQQFTWEENINQLKQVLRELIILADAPYIDEQSMRMILDRQDAERQGEHLQKSLDLQGTLDDIINEIIQIVYTQENGNQSRTARRLDISRSTLIRRLSVVSEQNTLMM